MGERADESTLASIPLSALRAELARREQVLRERLPELFDERGAFLPSRLSLADALDAFDGALLRPA